ncbi:hypothetical protein FK004_05905 [Flavobacterium kingsejongi]|uniref:Uncharacterized protein n=1 Tax=Flavobacterium kingsejongi TaxID=1678728 RepID=A0A2S1LM45_9FLAO|nr:hypothetical protein FK004_05905 [Flavobacterium kingsejongi]
MFYRIVGFLGERTTLIPLFKYTSCPDIPANNDSITIYFTTTNKKRAEKLFSALFTFLYILLIQP